MFTKSDNDLARTLAVMQDSAYSECNCDQTATVKKMAEWLAQDRRFDNFRDKASLAREAVDARQHGRVLDLSGKPKIELDPFRGYVRLP